MTIKVLVVDDSALIRQLLTELLNQAPDIEVVGAAQDPYIAREKIKQLNPDVVTLDVEMPRMDGLTFLRNLMRLRPMPVVMISSLTEKGAEITMEALSLGAVDFVAKPKLDVRAGLETYRDEIVDKVRAASRARVSALSTDTASPARTSKLSLSGIKATDKIVAIGASTGGTEAIKDIFVQLPADFPAVVVTQHIPEGFSASFAKRLDKCSDLIVSEAEDGQPIVPGHAYIAPGSFHLSVVRDGARYRCRVKDGERVNRHKPSVDVLFASVAAAAGKNALGVILTGMGNDGAQGLLAMKQQGAKTLAQDEKSSVVWGMPGEAVKAGGVDAQVALNAMAEAMVNSVRKL